MKNVSLNVTVPPDRRLVVQLPDDVERWRVGQRVTWRAPHFPAGKTVYGLNEYAHIAELDEVLA